MHGLTPHALVANAVRGVEGGSPETVQRMVAYAHSLGDALVMIDATSEKKMESCAIEASRSSLWSSNGANAQYTPSAATGMHTPGSIGCERRRL
eukprot:3159451-Prymnesium_polylepis.1